ncbi:hypothetical protein C4573_02230 [Candidatus Woesearchaeota archaeon]|nr:MAG: hypothetical protein C4573_02230 [Candidatus Woesearchaeota archaeon]
MELISKERIEELFGNEITIHEQKELLLKWVNHVRCYNEEDAIYQKTKILLAFGAFLSKPYELADPKDIDAFLAEKQLTNQSAKNYRSHITHFYQYVKRHTNFPINIALAYVNPQAYTPDRPTFESQNKRRVEALLTNEIMVCKRKDSRQLTQAQLRKKFPQEVLDVKNLKTLKDFYEYKMTSGKVCSNSSICGRLYYIKRLGVFLKDRNKTYRQAKRKDIQDYLTMVQARLSKKKPSDKPKMNQMYIGNILDFYRFIYKMFGEEHPRQYPKVVEWLNTRRKSEKDDVIPKEIIPDNEVKAMIEKCPDERDRAILSVLYDSSARISELMNCNIEDLKIREIKVDGTNYGHQVATIILRGKTGERTNQLFISVSHLRLWLKNHPFRDDPKRPLFVSTSGSHFGHRMTPTAVFYILQKVASQAGITRHIHPHLFRHTNLTRMARVLSESELKIHAGWEPNSPMALTYVHLNAKDVADKILTSYGLVTKEEQEKKGLLDVQICHNSVCSYTNPFDAQFCIKCGYPLNLKTALAIGKIKEREEALEKAVFAKDVPANSSSIDIKDLMFEIILADPELVKKLREIYIIKKEVQR